MIQRNIRRSGPTRPQPSSSAGLRPESISLADVLDRTLDKGSVIGVWARVSIVRIEILTVEARIVAAAVDTFLHYAQAITRLEQAATGEIEWEEVEIKTPTRPVAAVDR